MGKKSSRSKEAPPKEIDDALDEIDQLLECWENRLTIDNLALAKRYAKGEMGMGIEVRLEENHTKQFVAFFERKRCSHSMAGGDARSINSLEIGANGDDGAVFIDHIEALQAPEGFPAPSTVWLQPSEVFFSTRSHALKKRTPLGFGEVTTIPTYWEVGFVYDCLGGMAIGDDKARGKTVQRGSEVVHDIADDAAPLGWNRLDYVHLIDFYRRLRIFIDDDSVRLSGSEGRDLSTQIVKVLFGPVNLDPAAKDRMVSG
jgi:hypothetical protein